MSKKQLKPFTIIHNLEKLSDEERAVYLGKASEFMGLPADLNALDMLWMSDEASGLKRFVPYARKGTTDLLREVHGIKVLTMEELNGPGYVAFRATGVNAEGRQEVAIGAHGIDGLRGERLAAAVMTAETRAGRRLTLKFVGAGILDESEVSAVVSNIASSGASLAELAGSPTVVPPPPGAPNTAAGKDITDKQSQFEKDQQAMRDEASRQLRERPEKTFSGIEPAKEAVIPTTETVIASTPASVTGLNESVTTSTEKSAKTRQGRPRKKAGEVTFGTPETAPSEPIVPKQDSPTRCFDCGDILKDHPYINDKYVCKPKVSEPPATAQKEEGAVGTGSNALVPPLAEPFPVGTFSGTVGSDRLQAPPASLATALDKEQFHSFRARLREYANVILPRKGGMLPSEGIGGAPNKLRAFALKFTGATGVEFMSVRQWEELFEFLDSSTDPKALVAYINEAIGAK